MNLSRLQNFITSSSCESRETQSPLPWGSFIGAFIGTLPVMPFHTIGIIAVCMLTRNSTMAGLLASLAISNPFTYIPIYYVCMKIGNFLTPYEMSWAKIDAILDVIVSGHGFKESIEILSNLGSEIFIVMLTGGFVLALPTAIICYCFTLNLFIKIRERRRRRHVLQDKRK